MRKTLNLILLLVLLAGSPVLADSFPCTDGSYCVGIRSQAVMTVDPEGAGRQRSQNWCWAACVQMVLNYYGIGVTQEDVVRRVCGVLVDTTGSASDILRALDVDLRFPGGAIRLEPFPVARVSEMLHELALNRPLIVGLVNEGGRTSHAYVLTAAYYVPGELTWVVLRDPWPGSPSRRVMRGADFLRRVQLAIEVVPR